MTCLSWAPKAISIFTYVTSAITAFVATTGNGIIVVVAIKDPLKVLRTPFNYFLLNLSAADLIVGMITAPLACVLHVQESEGWMDKKLVKVFHTSFFISSAASIFSLVTLSIDRYFAICKPFKYHHYFTRRNCRFVTAAIWILAIVFSMMYYKVGFIVTLMFFACSSVLTGFVVLLFIYKKISNFMREMTNKNNKMFTTSEENEKKRMEKERKVTRVFLIMIVVYFVTNVTAIIMIFTLQFCVSCDCIFRHVLRDAQFFLITTNSCVNPFICTVRLKPFLNSIKKLFGINTNTVVVPKQSVVLNSSI